MEPTCLINDAEFWLPPEFLTDEDFLVDNDGGVDEFDETRRGFGSDLGFGDTVKPKSEEEIFLAGLTRRMVQSTLGDDFSSGGFCGGHAFPAANGDKPWSTTLCGAEIGCVCRNQRSNQNRQSRVSSQAAWDLYCAAVDEVTRMKISGEPYDYDDHFGRGLLDLPTKQSVSAAKISNNGTGYFNHHPLQYQKLQAIQFQQLKQQQLLKNHRRLVQQSRGVRVNSNKNGGPVGLLSSSAWSNQLPRRDNSCMRDVFVGNLIGKRNSTGTGVFLPRRVSHSSPVAAVKPTLVTAVNLNLDESSWRQRSNDDGFSSQMHGGVKAEQPVNETLLPSDWTY